MVCDRQDFYDRFSEKPQSKPVEKSRNQHTLNPKTDFEEDRLMREG